MKIRYVLFLAVVVIGLVVSGCNLGYANTDTNTTVVTQSSDTLATLPYTTANIPLVIETKADLLKVRDDLVYPCALILGDVGEGLTYNVFTNNDNTPVFGHQIGDKTCIQIYNPHITDSVYTLDYQDISAPSLYSQTGITYYSAPDGATNWVNFDKVVVVRSHELVSVPISIKVPSGAVTPKNWEFRINVVNQTYKTQFMAFPQIRVVISMRD